MPRYTEDDNGYIFLPDTPISKSGVFPYLGKNISPELEPDRIYQVWRPEEELNNPDTIESFKLAPWIPHHEMLGKNFTPAEKVGVEGVTGEDVQFRNGTLYAPLKLFGESLKQKIKAGLKELSCGFRCTWEIVSGTTPGGEAYQVVQRQIRGNHLASVPQGRMGSDVRVAMDRAVFALDHLDFELKPDGENMTIEELAKLIAQQGEQINTMSTAMDAMSKDMEEQKSKAKDMEEKDKKKAEDMEEEEEKKKAEDKEKSKAMDSALSTIAELSAKVEKLESNAMDGHALMKAYAEKQELANRVTSVVGAFDHADMTIEQVAKYGVEKLGIACDSGHEVTAVKVWLDAQKPRTFTVDRGKAQDQGDLKSETLDKMGL